DADPAGRAMQLLKGDSGERGGQGPAVRQQQVDRRVTQTTNDARLVVVAATGWPGLVEQGLDLRVWLRRDEIDQRLRRRPQRLQDPLSLLEQSCVARRQRDRGV